MTEELRRKLTTRPGKQLTTREGRKLPRLDKETEEELVAPPSIIEDLQPTKAKPTSFLFGDLKVAHDSVNIPKIQKPKVHQEPKVPELLKRPEGSMLEDRLIYQLKVEENAGKVGFKDSKWYPHSSVEGGSETIAYGHKLQKGEDFSEGLSELEALKLLEEDFEVARVKAQKVTGYVKLPENYQLILTELAFNTKGFKESKWPKLLTAMRAGDNIEVRKQMMRTYTNEQGKQVGLTKRVNALSKILLK